MFLWRFILSAWMNGFWLRATDWIRTFSSSGGQTYALSDLVFGWDLLRIRASLHKSQSASSSDSVTVSTKSDGSPLNSRERGSVERLCCTRSSSFMLSDSISELMSATVALYVWKIHFACVCQKVIHIQTNVHIVYEVQPTPIEKRSIKWLFFMMF